MYTDRETTRMYTFEQINSPSPTLEILPVLFLSEHDFLQEESCDCNWSVFFMFPMLCFVPLKLFTVFSLGSSNGIGRSTAELLARAGAKVTISGRNADTLMVFFFDIPIVDKFVGHERSLPQGRCWATGYFASDYFFLSW